MARERITISHLDGLTLAWAQDRPIAASERTLLLHEGGLTPTAYFPRENVLQGAHEPTNAQSHCPHKGDAAYFAVNDRQDRAWIYFDPFPTVSEIADHVAYYPDAADIETLPLPPVPDDARAVLKFWFDEVPPARQFNADDALNEAIAQRFSGLHRAATAGDLTAWLETPSGALALIILLDQFSRNLFPAKPEAFAQDRQAREFAHAMLERGFDLALPASRRAFVYLPFMHSEAMADQNLSVRLFEQRLPGSTNMAYAISHRQDIHRYGRFPYRDEALGR